MQITMNETRCGSESINSVKFYQKNETYDVADTLARHFIANGWAVEAKYKEAV